MLTTCGSLSVGSKAATRSAVDAFVISHSVDRSIKHSRNIFVMILTSISLSAFAFVAFRVCVSTVIQQQADDLGVARDRCPHEGSKPGAISCVCICSASKQRFDSLDVVWSKEL